MAEYKGASSEAGRALQLRKRREKHLEEMEHQKAKIAADLKLNEIDSKFATHYDAVEQQLKTSTIGLVTLDEMKAKQEDVVKERERQLAQKQEEKDEARRQEEEKKRQEKEKQRRQIQALSFSFGDEEEEDNDDDDNNDADKAIDNESGVKRSISSDDDDSNSRSKWKRVSKNPEVDTSFLPDRQREEEEKRLREQLRQEWVDKQNALKNETITITFSYWDGSGHRRQVSMKKGNSIYQFLQKCLEMLRKEFLELRTVSADQLVYVKEDLIIPHHYTFYDFIVTKARGKSGPLFEFDTKEDVRLQSDAARETEESHAGKVLLRSWYERNKHIFPASRWEPYDPTKKYSRYTISDKTKGS